VTARRASFLCGAIEGFYGKPWSIAERFELFDRMSEWGLNTYLYAPKDDLHHRAIWRELYPPPEAGGLKQIVAACRDRSLRFVYAISPGLDIRYGRGSELELLCGRFEQLLDMGCEHFAVLFDDIPDTFEAAAGGVGSLASAQCRIANALSDWLRARVADPHFLFCPTAYCGRMVEQKLGGEDYLPTVGRELAPAIHVLWTGPNIVSREITLAHLEEVARVLRRKPVIWDNLHANDYAGLRFFCGPYSGRPLQLREAAAGILSNPNNEFPLNYVPLRTLADFCATQSPWDPRAAYLTAMREWLPAFETVRGSLSFDDLVLFGDCCYLPHQQGAEAEELTPSKTARLREVCTRLTEVRSRPLFHALFRGIWALREQLDRVERQS
jgi:protein O-GlcNAcase/histone acetyltransferase